MDLGDDGFVWKPYLHNKDTTFLIFLQKYYPKIGNKAKNWTAYIFFHYLMRLFNRFTQGYLGECTLSGLSEDVCYTLICRFLSDRNTNSLSICKYNTEGDSLFSRRHFVTISKFISSSFCVTDYITLHFQILSFVPTLPSRWFTY